MPVPCGFFLWAQPPNFLPKGLNSRTVQRVICEWPVLLGCFVFPRSLPPFFAGLLLPPWGGGSRLGRCALPGAGSISRPRWPAGWRRFIGRFPGFSPFQEAAGRGWGALRFRVLAIFKKMFLGWPGMWPNPTHVLCLLSFPILHREKCNTVKVFLPLFTKALGLVESQIARF